MFSVEVAGFDIRKLVYGLAVRSPHPHLPDEEHCNGISGDHQEAHAVHRLVPRNVVRGK